MVTIYIGGQLVTVVAISAIKWQATAPEIIVITNNYHRWWSADGQSTIYRLGIIVTTNNLWASIWVLSTSVILN